MLRFAREQIVDTAQYHRSNGIYIDSLNTGQLFGYILFITRKIIFAEPANGSWNVEDAMTTKRLHWYQDLLQAPISRCHSGLRDEPRWRAATASLIRS